MGSVPHAGVTSRCAFSDFLPVHFRLGCHFCLSRLAKNFPDGGVHTFLASIDPLCCCLPFTNSSSSQPLFSSSSSLSRLLLFLLQSSLTNESLPDALSLCPGEDSRGQGRRGDFGLDFLQRELGPKRKTRNLRIIVKGENNMKSLPPSPRPAVCPQLCPRSSPLLPKWVSSPMDPLD